MNNITKTQNLVNKDLKILLGMKTLRISNMCNPKKNKKKLIRNLNIQTTLLNNQKTILKKCMKSGKRIETKRYNMQGKYKGRKNKGNKIGKSMQSTN